LFFELLSVNEYRNLEYLKVAITLSFGKFNTFFKFDFIEVKLLVFFKILAGDEIKGYPVPALTNQWVYPLFIAPGGTT